jgi:hypothetical protein
VLGDFAHHQRGTVLNADSPHHAADNQIGILKAIGGTSDHPAIYLAGAGHGLLSMLVGVPLGLLVAAGISSGF